MKPILTYNELKKYFIIGHKDVMKKEPITVKAVDGVSFEVLEGEAQDLQELVAIGRLVANSNQVSFRSVGQFKMDIPLVKTLLQQTKLDIDDLQQVLFIQSVKNYNLIDSVQEFRPEMVAKLISHRVSHSVIISFSAA